MSLSLLVGPCVCYTKQQQPQPQNTTTTTTTHTTTRSNNNNNNRRLSKACPSLLSLHLSRWTSAGSLPQELLSVASSDDCARGGVTSSSRSLRPWPRRYTTQPCGDRRRPGPGRRRGSCTSRPRSGSPLLASRSSSVCTKKSLEGGGLPAWQSRRGRRSGSSGAPWCRSSTLLCRKQWTSWWKCCGHSTLVPEQVIEAPKDHCPRRHPAARCASRAADGRTSGGRACALLRRLRAC